MQHKPLLKILVVEGTKLSVLMGLLRNEVETGTEYILWSRRRKEKNRTHLHREQFPTDHQTTNWTYYVLVRRSKQRSSS